MIAALLFSGLISPADLLMSLAVVIGAFIYGAYMLARRSRRQRVPSIVLPPAAKTSSQIQPPLVSAPAREAEISPPPIAAATTEERRSPAMSPCLLPDRSIEDVTRQSAPIPIASGLTKSPTPVPTWAHTYVYSAGELEYASQRQKDFYYAFRDAFVQGVNYDLEGNTNYEFILLFELVDTVRSSADVENVEKYLTRLAEFYPRTKHYIWSAFARQLENLGLVTDANRAWFKGREERSYFEDYWHYGNKHKKRLGLNTEEVKLLNRLPYPSNTFLSIQFCGDQVIRIFLLVVKYLNQMYRAESSDLNSELMAVADIGATRELRYRRGSQNYIYAVSSAIDGIYYLLFKHCENAVRNHLNHKRKLATEWHSTEASKQELESRIVSRLPLAISKAIKTVEIPDRDTEIELNKSNPSRWKIGLERLKAKTVWTGDEFVRAVCKLGEINAHNPNLEMIFFEASKFAAGFEKQASLTLYIHYLYHDLRSGKFDNRKLTKTIQKSLFARNEQLHDFERIVSELISKLNLNAALAAVANFYVPKRRHIQLDSNEITRTVVKDADTVELLNEYLQDEFEDEQNVIVASQTNDDDVVLEISVKPTGSDADSNDEVLELQTASETRGDMASNVGDQLSQTQRELLAEFERNGFVIAQSEVEIFAKQNRMFRNQLIESVNDACYDIIDDVLIEEDGDDYMVLENYYRMVVSE